MKEGDLFKMSMISSGYKALSGIYNLGKHISPGTGVMVAAAAAISTGISPIPRILLLGGTLLGAYCSAKQDIQIGELKNSLGNMNDTLQKLEHLTQQVENQVPGLRNIYSNIDVLIPRVDTQLSEQEMRLVRIGNSLQAIKDYQNGLKDLSSNLDNLYKGEVRLVEHVNHLEVLTKKEQNFKKDVGKQLTHWGHLVKELEVYGGADNQRLAQEIHQEIHTLIQAIHEANALKLREIKVVEQYNLSNPQERAQILADHAFNKKSLHPIPLIGKKVDHLDIQRPLATAG